MRAQQTNFAADTGYNDFVAGAEEAVVSQPLARYRRHMKVELVRFS